MVGGKPKALYNDTERNASASVEEKQSLHGSSPAVSAACRIDAVLNSRLLTL